MSHPPRKNYNTNKSALPHVLKYFFPFFGNRSLGTNSPMAKAGTVVVTFYLQLFGWSPYGRPLVRIGATQSQFSMIRGSKIVNSTRGSKNDKTKAAMRKATEEETYYMYVL